MLWKQKLGSNLQSLLQQALQTNQGRFSLLGLSIGLLYLPAWLGYLVPRILKGKIGWFLIASMLFLAGLELWSKRKVLRQLESAEEDRLLGYLLIGSSAILFPFCRFAIWPQSLLWLLILVGIVFSLWGAAFFRLFLMPTFFISLTVYPRIGLISRFLWEFFVPHQGLEKAMAWGATLAMQSVGFPAVNQDIYITFPEGAVEVGWGCNGLDMAITLAAAGLFMGILYKQPRNQMIALISMAVAIAFLANIPRLMLVTIAEIYWGPEWFKFWHGFWGGQIFSGVLFTIYYYVVEGLAKSKSTKVNDN
ncbi:cyanoexosortase C [cf. Phormidesmis sp. LEGE 11477]|uniref:cyanoexosortase C n=1 Tax=cf. Phormidesmis sp. LEGE 11477 TaxID=1828680 RepID=UPI00187E50FF|nr:cyanoexosortase C [cf. Phormidesmis sp. LEGE 11477]MBE9061247.1 cyanoexosortase C [cf. Phormidesmis sp. LEGE 11477]